MIALKNPSRRCRLLAVSTPGGAARQYRVQYQSADEGWRSHGSFCRQQQAEACLADLRARGLQARVVRYAISPVGL